MTRFTDFSPGSKETPLREVIYRSAKKTDCEAIARLIDEYIDPEFKSANSFPEDAYTFFLQKTRKEIDDMGDGEAFHMLVAEHECQLIGFGRSVRFDPKKNEVPFPAPAGWYLIGIVVSKSFRRRGVGRALTDERIKKISMVADEIFYFVESENKTSIALHQSLGFEKIGEGKGFLKISFCNGLGYLYRKSFDQK